MIPRILLFGRDESLLNTRSSVLNGTGLPILRANSLEQVAAIAATHNIAMLALCHTVSASDRRKGIAMVRHHHPEVLTTTVENAPEGKLPQRTHHVRPASPFAYPPAGTF